eukprot:8114771-Karenia_brevis.AAC.1
MTRVAMPATKRKGPATPRIPKVQVASFGLENYDRQWRRREDFSRIIEKTMYDLMESDKVMGDAAK